MRQDEYPDKLKEHFTHNLTPMNQKENQLFDKKIQIQKKEQQFEIRGKEHIKRGKESQLVKQGYIAIPGLTLEEQIIIQQKLKELDFKNPEYNSINKYYQEIFAKKRNDKLIKTLVVVWTILSLPAILSLDLSAIFLMWWMPSLLLFANYLDNRHVENQIKNYLKILNSPEYVPQVEVLVNQMSKSDTEEVLRVEVGVKTTSNTKEDSNKIFQELSDKGIKAKYFTFEQEEQALEYGIELKEVVDELNQSLKEKYIQKNISYYQALSLKETINKN